MARRVFFSFEYSHDVTRANVVRNSWVTQGKEAAGFEDAAEFEQLKRKGDQSCKTLDRQSAYRNIRNRCACWFVHLSQRVGEI